MNLIEAIILHVVVARQNLKDLGGIQSVALVRIRMEKPFQGESDIGLQDITDGALEQIINSRNCGMTHIQYQVSTA